MDDWSLYPSAIHHHKSAMAGRCAGRAGRRPPALPPPARQPVSPGRSAVRFVRPADCLGARSPLIGRDRGQATPVHVCQWTQPRRVRRQRARRAPAQFLRQSHQRRFALCADPPPVRPADRPDSRVGLRAFALCHPFFHHGVHRPPDHGLRVVGSLGGGQSAIPKSRPGLRPGLRRQTDGADLPPAGDWAWRCLPCHQPLPPGRRSASL